MNRDLEPKDVLNQLQKGEAILIDVREADEFAESHIPYAQSLPLSLLDKTFHHLTFPKGKTLIFHCKMGGRSSKACDYVSHVPDIDHKIRNLKGGIEAWEKDGLTVI